MAAIQTLTFNPGPPLTREALTMTSVTEYIHATALFGKLRRPIYRFTLRLGPLNRSQLNCLTALHAYHQGSNPFYWNGGEYGRVENYNLVDEGDGVDRTFYLPNRYVGAGSIAVRTVNQATGVASNWTVGYSLSPDAGILTFGNSASTIPLSGHDIQAKYGCVYRVNFEPGGIKTQDIAAGVYAAEIVLTENVLIP
jgi:hypothetical protein